MMTDNEFINSLKSMLLQELDDGHDNLVLFMFQKYPQLLDFSSEFLLKTTPESILGHYLKTFEKQKFIGSGLFAHCIQCQHKTKISNFENWTCSNTNCNKQHILN